jgi:hypothetical protein
MGLFKWLFDVGDEVETKHGKGKVQRFDSEGYVDVEVTDRYGRPVTKSVFGGNVKRKGGKKK